MTNEELDDWRWREAGKAMTGVNVLKHPVSEMDEYRRLVRENVTPETAETQDDRDLTAVLCAAHPVWLNEGADLVYGVNITQADLALRQALEAIRSRVRAETFGRVAKSLVARHDKESLGMIREGLALAIEDVRRCKEKTP